MESNTGMARLPDPKPRVGSEDESSDLGVASTVRRNPHEIQMDPMA